MPLSFESRTPVSDTIHGVRVSDPCRWLEDRTLPETEHWLRRQRKRCNDYFARCGALPRLRGRVWDFLNTEVLDQPAKVGGRYFYRRRGRDEEQGSLYARETPTGKERLLVDPAGEGRFASVRIHSIAVDASLLAYEIRHGGADRTEIRIVEVGSGRVFKDRISTGYARGFAFDLADQGFYFCHEVDLQGSEHRILFHPFSEFGSDRVVFRRERTRASRMTLIADAVHLGARWIHERGHDLVCDFYMARRDRDEDWYPVFIDRDPPYSPVLDQGRIFVFCRDEARNGKIIEIGIDGREMHTVVPEFRIPPRQIVLAGSTFFLSYFRDGRSSIHAWTVDGVDTGDVEIPAEGSCSLLPVTGPHESSAFYVQESFDRPRAIFEVLPDSIESRPLGGQPALCESLACHVDSLAFASKDGTAIPITLVSRTGGLLRKPRPVIITGYGGFGIPVVPQFSVLVAIMTELGATFALPHIRGGGDFGKDWHDAGRARNRQTAVDDLIAATEWLCAEGLTSPSRIAIFGGSNAGLLAAAAMIERPDLFRAVLLIAPLLDMVRFEELNPAARWRKEYGTRNDLADFHALYALSPYHRIQDDVNYPATLFVTGDQDDRCNPAHVRKMAARLEERANQQNAILVDHSAERGHSPELPLSVRVDALARRLAFLCRELNIDVSSEGSNEQTHF